MNRFTKIGADGQKLPNDATEWVANLDPVSGLMWQKDDLGELDFKAAQKAVGTLELAGFKDWRLPTVEELFCLADRTRANPAIDVEAFPDCKSDWYWSGTAAAPSPGDYAWVVYFSNGLSYWLNQSFECFVRAVRAGQ